MKKVFVGLLIVAAGAAILFLLQKKNNPARTYIQKDLIIGKWKLDSLYNLKDSSSNQFRFIKYPEENDLRCFLRTPVN